MRCLLVAVALVVDLAAASEKHLRRHKAPLQFREDRRGHREQRDSDGEAIASQTRVRLLSEQVPIWVHAYARSGSSTVLSMVSQVGAFSGLQTDAKLGSVFSLFEPCHEGDVLDTSLADRGCPGLLTQLSKCRFENIKSLHGWKDVHSKTRGAGAFETATANRACMGADLVSFKTISQAGQRFKVDRDALPVLEQDQRLHMVDVVRDPRSIFASWMTTFPFNDTKLGGVSRDVKHLTALCESFASGLDVRHPRYHRVVFEKLAENPEETMKKVYQYLHFPFGKRQQTWIQNTFHAKECPGVDRFIAAYSDCHTTTAKETAEKWRSVLTRSEISAFQAHPACKALARAYNYPLE